MSSLFARMTLLAAALWGMTAGLAPAPAAAEAVELRAVPRPPTSNAQVIVPVDVRASGGLGALELEITYDPSVLEFVSVKGDALLDSALLEHQGLEPGRVRLALVSSDPITEDGTLLVATFTALATTGTTRVALEQAMAWDHENVFEMRVLAEGATLDLAPRGKAPSTGLIAVVVAIVVLLVLVGRRGRRRRTEVVYPDAPGR
jgi:hypothetical protein